MKVFEVKQINDFEKIKEYEDVKNIKCTKKQRKVLKRKLKESEGKIISQTINKEERYFSGTSIITKKQFIDFNKHDYAFYEVEPSQGTFKPIKRWLVPNEVMVTTKLFNDIRLKMNDKPFSKPVSLRDEDDDSIHYLTLDHVPKTFFKEEIKMKISEYTNKPCYVKMKEYEDISEISLEKMQKTRLKQRLENSKGEVVSITIGDKKRYFTNSVDNITNEYINKTEQLVENSKESIYEFSKEGHNDFKYCNYQKAENVLKFNDEWGIELLTGSNVQSNHSFITLKREYEVAKCAGLRFVSVDTWVRSDEFEAGWGPYWIVEPMDYLDAMKELMNDKKIIKDKEYSDDGTLILSFNAKDFNDMIDIVYNHTAAFYFVSTKFQPSWHEPYTEANEYDLYSHIFFTPTPDWSKRREEDQSKRIKHIINEFKKMHIKNFNL